MFTRHIACVKEKYATSFIQKSITYDDGEKFFGQKAGEEREKTALTTWI